LKMSKYNKFISTCATLLPNNEDFFFGTNSISIIQGDSYRPPGSFLPVVLERIIASRRNLLQKLCLSSSSQPTHVCVIFHFILHKRYEIVGLNDTGLLFGSPCICCLRKAVHVNLSEYCIVNTMAKKQDVQRM
jgi:hypothetical protein